MWQREVIEALQSLSPRVLASLDQTAALSLAKGQVPKKHVLASWVASCLSSQDFLGHRDSLIALIASAPNTELHWTYRSGLDRGLEDEQDPRQSAAAILRECVHPCFIELLFRHLTESPTEIKLADLCHEAVNVWSSKDIAYRIVCPLINLAGERYCIPGSVYELWPWSELPKDVEWPIELSGQPSIKPVNPGVACLVRHFTEAKSEPPGGLVMREVQRARAFIAATRCAGLLSVGADVLLLTQAGSGRWQDRNSSWMRDVDDCHIEKSSRLNVTYIESLVADHPQTLRVIECTAQKLLWAESACESVISAAIARYLSAGSRSRPEDRWLDYVLTIEYLLGADTEISYRVSLRAASLAKSIGWEPQDLFTYVKKAYDHRNKIVHAGKTLQSLLKCNWLEERNHLAKLSNVSGLLLLEVIDRMRRSGSEDTKSLQDLKREIDDSLLFALAAAPSSRGH